MSCFEDITENDFYGVHCEMIVDLLVEVVARLKELHDLEVVLLWVHYLIVYHSCILEQDSVVVLAEREAHHLCVPLDVVPLVNVN